MKTQTQHNWLVLGLLLVTTLVACPGTPNFELQTPVATLSLARGATVKANLGVTRTNLEAAIGVTLSNPPVGISANPISLTGSAGTLELAASADAVLGPQNVTVAATGGAVSKNATISINVVAVAAPQVVVDTTLKPQLETISNPFGAAPRPLASLGSRSGGQADFVLNEVLVVSKDRGVLDALLARWGGTILSEVNFQTIAPAFRTDTATAPSVYLVRIDPKNADLATLPAKLQQLQPSATGEMRVSSEAAARFLAALTSEASDHNMQVAANFVVAPASIATGSTTESTTTTASGFNRDAFTWPYMGTGAAFPMNTGVTQAWQQLEAAGKFSNRVRVLVADGGFSPSTTGADLPSVVPFGRTEQPNPLPCTGGSSCPWHGSNVLSALAALPDNNAGAAGPAGPVADPMFLQSPVMSVGPGFDVGGVIISIGNGLDYAVRAGASLGSRPRILNFSGSFKVDGGWGFVVSPLDAIFSLLKDSFGILTFAAAGNDGALDVDDITCYGLGSPSVCAGVVAERDVYVPCEMAAVICVGGLEWNATTKHPNSSFGRAQRFAGETSDDANTNDGSVDLYGPFQTWVAPTPSDPEVRLAGGTSFSSPFVAGVAALIVAANPAQSAHQVQQVLLETAHRTTNLVGETGGLRVNAAGAIRRVLGEPPTLTLARSGFVGNATLNRDFVLVATPRDSEDGAACCNVTWSPTPASVTTGGRGATYRFNTVGNQTFTASISDSAGNTVRQSITVNVVNSAPTVTITTPGSAITVYSNASTSFAAFATDPNEGAGPSDGQLACNQLRVRSNLAGDSAMPATLSGTAPNCQVAYAFTTLGARTITVSATDLQGATETDTVLVTVVAQPVNPGPSASFTLPPVNYTDGYGNDLPIRISGAASADPDSPYTYTWVARSYVIGTTNSSIYATRTVRTQTGAGSSDVFDWTPINTAGLVDLRFTGSPSCYDGQTIVLTLTITDALGNVGTSFARTFKVYCRLI